MSDQFERHEIEETYIPAGLAALHSLEAVIKDEPPGEGTLAWSHDFQPTQDESYLLSRHSSTYQALVVETISPELVQAHTPPAYLLAICGALAIALVDHENSRPRPAYAVSTLRPDREALDDEIQLSWMRHNGEATLPLFSAGYPDRISLQLVPHEKSYAIAYVVERHFIRVNSGVGHDVTVKPARPALLSRLTKGYRRRTHRAADQDLST